MVSDGRVSGGEVHVVQTAKRTGNNYYIVRCPKCAHICRFINFYGRMDTMIDSYGIECSSCGNQFSIFLSDDLGI